MRHPRSFVVLLAAGLVVLTGCGSPSAQEIASALRADGAKESVARCIALQALASDISTDSLDRLAEQGVFDEDGERVQFLEDDSAIILSFITACAE